VSVSYTPIEPGIKGNYPPTGSLLLSVAVAFLLGLFGGIAAPLAVDYLKPPPPTANIVIDFEPHSPFVVADGSNLSGAKKDHVLRVSVENRSARVTARNCSAMLTGLWHETKKGRFKAAKQFDPVLLKWLPYMPVDIRPGIKVFVPFGEIVPRDGSTATLDAPSVRTGRPAEFRLRAPAWPPGAEKILPPGKHRIRLTIAFEDMAPVDQLLEIDWSGRWADDPREIMKLVSISKKT
jgi:hypothetical protein